MRLLACYLHILKELVCTEGKFIDGVMFPTSCSSPNVVIKSELPINMFKALISNPANILLKACVM